jgi:hypothetical protein
MLKDDAVIARIREARHQISAEQSHDPGKLVAHYIELQKQQRRPLLESRPNEVHTGTR